MNKTLTSRIAVSIDSMRLRYSAIGVFLFYMAANAFALFNYYPQHDSLNYLEYRTTYWDTVIGRFLTPLYVKLRGNYTVPWLIGVITMICLTAITYMVSKMIAIRKPMLILGTAGILSANFTHTELLGSYTFCEDQLTVSVLLAVLAFYLVWQKWSGKRVLLSVFLIVMSMGLYQANIAFPVTLMLLLVCKELLHGGSLRGSEMRKYLRFLLPAAAAVLCYVPVNTIVLKINGYTELNDYHSFGKLLQDRSGIPQKMAGIYEKLLDKFFVNRDMPMLSVGCARKSGSFLGFGW